MTRVSNIPLNIIGVCVCVVNIELMFFTPSGILFVQYVVVLTMAF